MKLLNLIVAGPPASGKRTLIRSLTSSVFSTPEEISAGKSGKSCVVEFGRLQVEPDFFLYLAAVPSDENFQFIWERLAQGLIGFIVMFDAKTREGLNETKDMVKMLKSLTDTPFVVAFNGIKGNKEKIVELKKEFTIPREEQVVCCDVTNKESAKELLISILKVGLKQIKKRSA